MSELVISGTGLGTSLQALLMSDEIVPGSDPSYQLCKILYTYHPLGKKMVDGPIKKAQSQRREITVPNGPEERVREAFEEEWKALGADAIIANAMSLARIYGISSLVALTDGTPSDRPLNFKELYKADLAFNVLDPLNTAGSLVLVQDPNAAAPEAMSAERMRPRVK